MAVIKIYKYTVCIAINLAQIVDKFFKIMIINIIKLKIINTIKLKRLILVSRTYLPMEIHLHKFYLSVTFSFPG